MAYRITPTEVRQRLRKLNTTQLDDTTLNSKAYIPYAEAKTDSWLARGSVTYASLAAYQQVLIDAAEIGICAARVLAYAPEESLFLIGPFNPITVSVKDRVALIEEIEKEILDDLSAAGVKLSRCYISFSGGSDYEPDGYDSTQIDYSTTNYSLWA
jgi:hypothetical protein